MQNKLETDIKLATEIVQKYHYGNSSLEKSRIYPFSNELLSSYEKYFKKKSEMLSVIGSGDQIFNAILKGIKHIEAFDINELAKYYFYFKKAAIEVLNRREFVDMFIDYSISLDDVYYECIIEIIQHLEPNIKIFWEKLMRLCDYDWYFMRTSKLFYNVGQLNEDIIYTNSYLSDDGYLELKKSLKNAHIEVKDGNILNLADEYSPKKFDLIYLSNIWAYVHWLEYSEMLKKLKLTNNGVLIAYSFREKTEPYPDVFAKKKILSPNEALITYNSKL